MRPILLTILLSGALVAGCSRDIDPGDDTNTDDTSDDTSADDTGDTDTGGDTDTDTGGDTDTNVLDCQATYATPDPGGDTSYRDCLTEAVTCGDVVLGTTEGGSTYFGNDWGSGSNTKWPTYLGCAGTTDWTDSFSAPERVYKFDMQDSSGKIRVETCAGLYPLIIRTFECPSTTNMEANDCRAMDEVDPGVFEYDNLFHSYDWVVVVEGINGATGNYKIEFTCD